MLEQYQTNNHFLQQVNPLAKLIALLVVIAAMIFVFDPWTPFLLWVVSVLMLHLLGGIPVKFITLISIPFMLFGLTFVWINAVFPAERGELILFSLFGLPIALENIQTGLSLGFRSLVFGTWSLLFVLTTSPTIFLHSLIQNGKLSPRFGYGIMAAYRLIPVFKNEWQQLKLAHRIRGLGEKGGLIGRYRQMKRYAIPLLASAIRKASRLAIAMESKGFDGSRNRTYYRVIRWSSKDAFFAMGVSSILTVLMISRQWWI
ncbi:energy-coupling factor transport system permease protein [Geomicrobium halophilum]|uniref:Energy-coupling factor transport system permease protein n=1 Tax=Geomicrobium halophilum TaxID=549000 RepID=A0A841PNH0_9BACL|nr:energy-coupling factor transporter transmembrane component T [Geomicrobium halophilum]MBB6450299.1 energy-coupling factor transport system permease protein [Geomicrobium halophilum]